MHEPRVLSLGRAVPERRVTQLELYEHSPWERSPLTDRLVYESPIRTRALFAPPEFYARAHTLTETNALWREGALSLAGEALQTSLRGAGLSPQELDAIGVTTVTGYTTPGLDLLLAHTHEMRPDIQRLHFNNIGCHAAIPLLRSMADHVARRPGTRAAAVAVEVCSACFTHESDPQNIVASSLFADGAASVILSTEGEGPVLVDFASGFDFEYIESLGFELTTTGFRIVLDPQIPDRIAASIARVVDGLLSRHDLDRRAVSRWGLHPGGSRVLDAAQQALELTDEDMLASRRVLRSYGNMSSPSILFVLGELLSEPVAPPEGSYGVLAAFGPGLGIEVALLRF
jgi:alkylresorcinol/alkylpyrone synthase